MRDHVVVFSHRRSGTHLTIDAVRNNFDGYGAPYLNMDVLQGFGQTENSVASFTDGLRASPRVLKSHAPADLETHFAAEAALGAVRNITGRAKIIYVHRDGRDVMASLYHYARSIDPALEATAFSTFLRMTDPLGVRSSHRSLNPVEYWRHHVAGWLERENVLFVSFESLRQNFDDAILRLGDFLDRPVPPEITRVVRKAPRNTPSWNLWSRGREKLYKLVKRFVTGVELTSVNFRRGRVGTYLNVFEPDDLDFFYEIAGDVMDELGYEASQAEIFDS